nr:fumarylacetoacetate hydrolase family protein [Bordetella sp. BOR01]
MDARGTIRDLSAHIPDINGTVLASQAWQSLAALDIDALPTVPPGVRYGPPVGQVGKIVCVGLNYSDHAQESGAPVPTEPVLFMKPASSICGPYDNVEIPRGSTKTDWEVELGLVIGRRAKYVESADALQYLAGYCIVNDVSEREFQLERQGQWDKGKGHDTFAPIGPWLVTPGEIADAGRLSLWLEVNGKRFQDGSTENLVFGVAHLISYISRFMTLEPGDIVSTGTPAGVGLGQKPPLYLKPGDEMVLGIEGLGSQRQRCVPASA